MPGGSHCIHQPAVPAPLAVVVTLPGEVDVSGLEVTAADQVRAGGPDDR